jgi:hypothetical protein
MQKLIFGFIFVVIFIVIFAVKKSLPNFSNPIDVKVLQAKFNF